MADRAPRDGAPVLLVAVAALLAEAVLLGALARRGTLPLPMAGHLVAVVAIGGWASRPARRGSRGALLLWVATAAFGPFGPAGVLLTIALERRYARRATGLEEWHAMLFPPTRVDEHADLWRRIGQRASDLGGKQQVTPFLDVLAFGSVPQRQSVIAIIVQQFHPAFAPALKAALRDEHNVIRVQAATAIARLENDLLDKTLRLESALRSDPDNPAAILALATHYDDQAFTGLLDGTREHESRVKAAEGYARYLDTHPGDRATRFRLARLQQRRGLLREAEVLFRDLVEAGHPGVRHWLMENLFVQGRFADLRAVAAGRGADAARPSSAEVSATMALWTAEREAAA